MPELARVVSFILLTFFLLSISKSRSRKNSHSLLSSTIGFVSGDVQCRSVLTEPNDRPSRSLRNLDYINMCMFRKTRLCDCKTSREMHSSMNCSFSSSARHGLWANRWNEVLEETRLHRGRNDLVFDLETIERCGSVASVNSTVIGRSDVGNLFSLPDAIIIISINIDGQQCLSPSLILYSKLNSEFIYK